MFKHKFICRAGAVLLALAVFLAPGGALAETLPVDVNGAAALLVVEASSMQPVLAYNENAPLQVAGLARLPLLLLVCEGVDAGALSLDDTVTVTQAAAAIKGPTAFLEANEAISARELLKAAVMIGAGDAMASLAIKLYGTQAAVLQAMAARLEALGIDAQYTDLASTSTPLSAVDIAKLGRLLARSEAFNLYSGLYLDGIIHEDDRYTELVNPNRLIRDYPGCTGVATGSSNTAGYCGVFSVNLTEASLMVVVVGTPNSKARFAAAQSALDYAAASFSFIRLAQAGEVMLENVPVANGTQARVDLIAMTDLTLVATKESVVPRHSYNVPEQLQAPFAAGDQLGSVDYYDADDNLLASLPLSTTVSCEVAGLTDFFRSICLHWLRA